MNKEIIERIENNINILSANYLNGDQIQAIENIKEILEDEKIKLHCISDNVVYNKPQIIVDLFQGKIGDEEQEHFMVAYLNAAGKLIKTETLFIGNKNSSVVGVDIIFRKAILNKASAIIVSHNHPSGNVQPSATDSKITKELKQAGDLLGIKLCDHIIVCPGDNYFSFVNEGLIWYYLILIIY